MTISIEDVRSIAPETQVQFQLQVKRMETGELHANKEDIDKLNAIPQLVNSGLDANQLIYSALNIGSHMEGVTYTAQLLNGVHSTVSPSLQPSKGVLSSYSITFQAPQVQATQPSCSRQVVYQLQPMEDQGLPITEAASESSEPNSQGTEQEDDSILTLEVSQASSEDQVAQILYSHEAQGVSKDSSEGFRVQNSSFQVLEVASKETSPVEAKLVEDFVNAPRAVVVSQAGVDGVLLTEDGQSIMVMEGGQVVQGLMDGGTVLEGGQVVGGVLETEEDSESVGVAKTNSTNGGVQVQTIGNLGGDQVVQSMLENQQVAKGRQVVQKVLVMTTDNANGDSCQQLDQVEQDK